MSGGSFSDAGVTQDVEPLGVRLHQSVLDAVVDHLDEVPGARRAAVEVALFGRASLLRDQGARDVADARGERLRNRVEAPNDLFGRRRS